MGPGGGSQEIIDGLTEAVGKGNVLLDPSDLDAFACGQVGMNGAERLKPDAIVRPGDPDEVKALVDLANRLRLNLVPVSSGPPHTRGGTAILAESTPGVVVDMSRMDRIVRIDRRNKVALVEPGVTFGQLHAAAREAGLKVLSPLLPRATKSVVASSLDREPIVIPKYHWDMTDPLLCTEVEFGTGDFFRTGGASGPGTLEQQWAVGAAQKNPMGPAQTDLVRVIQGAQGTMGIVTWASIKLEVKPRIHRLYFVPAGDFATLAELAYRLIRRKLADEFMIFNDFELSCLACLASGEGCEPVSAEDLAPYTAVLGVSGYELQPEKRVAYQEHDIREHAAELGLKLTDAIAGASADSLDKLLEDASPEPYCKTRPKGGYRDIFFLTTLDGVPPMLELIDGMIAQAGYQPEEKGVYVQPIQHGRLCQVELTLFYDPRDEAETARMSGLVSDACAALAEAGAFFSRPYEPWTRVAYERCGDTVAALRKVKRIFDPNGVMNRGHLCFQGDENGAH